jgi:hypothetical protein
MAKAKVADVKAFIGGGKVSRPGRHSKNRTSKSKTSKNYKKRYRGQGK